MKPAGERCAAALFDLEYQKIVRRTDRMFAFLMLIQWGAAIVIAYLISPHTWAGDSRTTHAHVFAAVFLGGAITSLPVFLAFARPGRQSTRYVLAIGQSLWSALLIHITGGRIETHFHIFGSLAFLAFYRDLKVLIPASLVVAADHFLRGVWWPESVYGVTNPEWWRFLEHGGWVLFIDIFLISNCRTSYADLRRLCRRQTELEVSKVSLQRAALRLESRVEERTTELCATVDELERTQVELVERQNQEREALEVRRRELFRFLEQMPVGVFVVDANGTPVFASEEAVRILGAGIMPGAAVGNLAEIYAVKRRGTDELYPEAELPVVRAIRGESVSTGDIEIDRGNDRIPVYAKAAPIRDDEGEIMFGLVAFEDISKKVRAEAERLQGQKLESVGQLAAGIAHEINTPMQYIGDNTHFLDKVIGNLWEMLDYQKDLLVEHTDDVTIASANANAKRLKLDYLKRRIPRALTATIEGVAAVSKLVASMKEFSHPGSDEKTPTDINRAIESTVTVSKNEWKYVAELETSLDSALPLVPALPGELNQVILNIVVNGAHAIADRVGESGEKGEIRIATRCDGTCVEISISDTGAGIPPAVRTKIFDPFFTTKEVGKGTGQGLAIARSIIVDKHGGTIDLDSEIGRGTTFTIRLPIEAETETAEVA